MGKFNLSTISIAIALAFALGSCKFGPNFSKPQPKANAHYLNDSLQTDSVMNLAWWEMFNDPILDTLIKTALDSNKDVLLTAARIEESRAALGMNKANTWPSFTYQGQAQHGNYTGIMLPEPNTNGFGSANLNWEIDFWGKYRRATESARADLLAQAFNQRTVQIGLISEVASAYFQLLDFQWRYEISQQTVDLRKENVDIIQMKYDGGLVPEIDLNNAQMQYAIALSALPEYERSIAIQKNVLNVLLGSNPKPLLTGDSLEHQSFPPEIPAGLPSQLLTRRPDIGYSEARYHSQMAKIGVAQAQRFPSIGLTGLLGTASDALGVAASGGTNLAWNVGGNIAGPIFEFGKNKRRVEVEKARTEQTRLQYEQTVLQAFKEVEDALISISTYKKELEARKLQASTAINSRTLSQLRYDKGVTSYLEVLTLQEYAFNAELALSATRAQLFISYIKLYKALGGGWISEDERQAAQENNEANPNNLPNNIPDKKPKQ